ncbi:MAG: hypothetical protein JWM27_3009 [Gemmatimonadetes bacterium]|nr:hypothetical protein [Gemmatimonadota bacterium]
MELRTRRWMLTGVVTALALAASACESPTLVSRPAPAAGIERLIVEAAPGTLSPATQARDTLFKRCGGVTTGCEGDDTVVIHEPGGGLTPVRVFTDSGSQVVVSGTDTVTAQLGIWDNGDTTNGDFIGVLWRHGQFAGYWGHCSFVDGLNLQYTTTDPAGNVYIHWENTHANPNDPEMYHYIYDPVHNTLKIYHRHSDGSTVLIYFGPPIQNADKLFPYVPDPPAGHGPWTNESQWPGQHPTGGGGAGGSPPASGGSPAPGGSSPAPGFGMDE